MSDQPFVEKIKLALADLDQAATDAENALPREIKQELFAARQSLATVSLIRMVANGNIDNLEMQALALIQDFRNGWSAIKGAIATQGRPVDLTLGQHRQR